MEHLKSLGRIVYLKLGYPALERRVTNLATRGIAFAPGQTLADVYRQREPLYQRWADVTVAVDDGQGPAATLEAVRAALGAY